MQVPKGVAVEPDVGGIGAANDQQRRSCHIAERVCREVDSAAARNDGGNDRRVTSSDDAELATGLGDAGKSGS